MQKFALIFLLGYKKPTKILGVLVSLTLGMSRIYELINIYFLNNFKQVNKTLSSAGQNLKDAPSWIKLKSLVNLYLGRCSVAQWIER